MSIVRRITNTNRWSTSGYSTPALLLPNDYESREVLTLWHRYLENEEMRNFPKARIELFAPSMATFLKLANDTAVSRELLSQMPDLVENKTTHIFIPVNGDRRSDHDTDNVKFNGDQSSAGIHWSLLVISLIDNVAFHYDSLNSLNSNDARDLLQGIEAALPVPRTLRFVEMQDSPQQSDGWNCGIFALVIMKHLLLKRLLRADANQKITMSTSDPNRTKRTSGRSSAGSKQGTCVTC